MWDITAMVIGISIGIVIIVWVWDFWEMIRDENKRITKEARKGRR